MNLIKKISANGKQTIKRHFYTPKLNKYPDLDFDYLCSASNCEEILNNITRRKGVGDIHSVQKFKKQLENSKNATDHDKLKQLLYTEALKIPNRTHPDVLKYTTDINIVRFINQKKNFDFHPQEFHEISKKLNLVRTDQLGNLSGNRSYYVLGEMAELEQALINYTVNKLFEKGFQLMSVPDILHRNIIENCGMNTKGERNQVYLLDQKLYGPDFCLAGTSEMSLAGFLMNKTFSRRELPTKLAAVSRCYRAETSSTSEERGIYRVHEFTKVEMFVISTPESSEDHLEELITIEQDLFGDMGLYLRVLDMPPHELGAPAYRKYDIEAWLPGRKIFGEISSCSNCTDYQSRRLNIKYSSDNDLRYVHTLNGTACAIPRMLIALTETYQTEKGSIEVPNVLQKYMNNKMAIGRQKTIPELKLVKNKKEK
ncbi:serine--tRNA ligase, mitochondrial isoform X1 [Agrilus planipennis]|uniref:serine--tRNA ligase n=2 Tax=Agrilus planipennis TaxID=224129 RepID=A0A7F5RJD9_AGRPL|nr:serine--tRNA ligase, mitochondrial isoform X1 [Agrilus planipennis]